MRTHPRTPLLAFAIALLASAIAMWLIFAWANRVPISWPAPASYQPR